MITSLQLAWAAGFLEGEGCFHIRPQITASQVQKEPLERLASIFGGMIKQYGPYKNRHTQNQYWLWRISGSKSAGIAMTIFGHMSPRRQVQIKAMLDDWKSKTGPTFNRNYDPDKCPQGHNDWFIVKKSGWRSCRVCNRERKRKDYKRLTD